MDFAKIRPRGGTKAQWEKANPVLAKREMGVQWETTIGVGEVIIKIGDGVNNWINLQEAVKSDITKKIIAALAVVPDDDPDLADGDSLDTLFGKIAKKFKYLKDNKLDKSALYDGTDSTSTKLAPTANALRGVNAKADKNASDITTLNNNLSNSLQYVHTAKNPFDFNDVNTPAGFHRVNDSDSFKNPPLEIQNNANINYGNIFVCKSNENSDTLSMTFYPYDQNTIFIKTANFTSWEGKGWTQLVSKSDSLRFSRTYIDGNPYADAKNLSIPPGIYSVNPDFKNIPETTYGFLEIVADSTNNWRLIKFIPTNIKSYYLMFYNGYDKTWSGWVHFTSVS